MTIRSIGILTAATLSFAVAAGTADAQRTVVQRQNPTKVGTLTCDISAGIGFIIGSKKDVKCMFTPSGAGRREVYVGSISKFGLDIGATAGGEMAWAVYMPTNARVAALAGDYTGASAEATVGAGVGGSGF